MMSSSRVAGPRKVQRLVARLLPRLLILGVSVAVTLAAGEVVARAWFPPAAEHLDDRLVASGYYEAHPVLGWRPRPNIEGRFLRFDATFRTNSRGLRDREYRLDRMPGVPRIVVLGDSFTWGYGVNDDQIFTEILEARLRGPEVINLGVTAFGLPQEIEYLTREGLLYRPDTVVLAFCLNDIYRDGLPVQEAYRARQRVESPRPATTTLGFKAWLGDRMALYQLARQAVNTNKTLVNLLVRAGVKDNLLGFDGLDNNLMPALRAYPPGLERSLEQTRAELLDLRGFLAERNIRFVLALIPSLQSIDRKAFRHSIAYTKFEESDFDLEKPYRLLEGFAREHGIEVVNTFPALKRQHDSGVRLYLANDPHFNAAGHEAFAGELARYFTGKDRS